ncbi:MAG: phosphoglucosamine mutase [Desulfurococcales archaeon]|nr:phosphoglucosamine mutase [Desulfurococcales archaeon]
MNRLFGTDGVRGVVNKELDPEMVLRLAQAIGSFFDEGSRILVGRDSRVGGEMIKSLVIGGLISTGVKIYDAGLTPTPALQYVIAHEGFDGGVMITASHNPPEYNGIKVIDSDGIEVPREKEEVIEEYFFEKKFRRVPWRSLVHEATPYPYVNDIYVKAVLSHADKELIRSRGFKVVVDAANSVGALTSPRIARELGVKVISINASIDPLFPGRLPEPTVETLSETAKIVSNISADFGIAHDGDADRAIVIDDKGRVQWGDRTATILARYLADKHSDLPRRVFTAVSSSIIIEDVLKPMGIEVVWLKVGSIGISRALASQGGICGFEENGGFMYPLHHPVRDGGITLVLLLQMLAEYKCELSELFDELPQYYALKTKIPMPREVALTVVERVKEYFKNYRQVTIDGVKVIGRDFWILVRPSGTEPLLRIMIEAKDVEKANELLGIVKNLVKEVVPG